MGLRVSHSHRIEEVGVMFTINAAYDQPSDQAYRNRRAAASGLNQFVPVIVPQPGLCVTLRDGTRSPVTAR
jgi:hypothetical protein